MSVLMSEPRTTFLQPSGMPGQGSGPATVLVVDDSPETLTMLTDAFRLDGMTVLVADSGRAALQMASVDPPDIILMDAIMPGMDGFETCRILKTEPQLADIPVIFMTGLDQSEHVVAALAAGGVDFVHKPVPLVELFARMQVHLGNARKARSARKALDTTGRRIVAVDRRGTIMWTTPQAAELLALAGIHVESEARMPWEVTGWLADAATQRNGVDDTGIEVVRNQRRLCFRLVGRTPEGEHLLRVVDRDAGTEEERLAAAFDLTIREAEVLLWITHSKSNKEIAEILDMSPRTVNKHLEQIFDKLGVENRTAAATMSVRVLWD